MRHVQRERDRNRQTNKQIDRQTDKGTDRRRKREGQTDGGTDGGRDGGRDGQMEGGTEGRKDRRTEGGTDRWREGGRDRQTEGGREGETGREGGTDKTNRQTDVVTNIYYFLEFLKSAGNENKRSSSKGCNGTRWNVSPCLEGKAVAHCSSLYIQWLQNYFVNNIGETMHLRSYWRFHWRHKKEGENLDT